MTYPCPYGCDTGHISTLRGWKTHMGAIHGGATDDELATVAGIAQEQEDVAERMRKFTETIPEAGSTSAPALPPAEPQGPQPPVPAETEKKVRRIRATPKKAKRIFTKIPEKILEAQKIELDDEDREGLAEATDFLEDIFGLEFEVPEEKYTVHSRFLALLWPVAIVLIIFLKHRIGVNLFKIDEEPADEAHV